MKSTDVETYPAKLHMCPRPQVLPEVVKRVEAFFVEAKLGPTTPDLQTRTVKDVVKGMYSFLFVDAANLPHVCNVMYVCMFVFMYVCLCVCMFDCMYVCMYVCGYNV
jgi:hypothetical protein